jgi:hypothetical protein
MIKAYIHITNHTEFMDEKVRVEIKLPALPIQGSHITLSEKTLLILEEKARVSDSCYNYHPEWFRGETDEDFEELENYDCLTFIDAQLIDEVLMYEDDEHVYIELKKI